MNNRGLPFKWWWWFRNQCPKSAEAPTGDKLRHTQSPTLNVHIHFFLWMYVSTRYLAQWGRKQRRGYITYIRASLLIPHTNIVLFSISRRHIDNKALKYIQASLPHSAQLSCPAFSILDFNSWKILNTPPAVPQKHPVHTKGDDRTR